MFKSILYCGFVFGLVALTGCKKASLERVKLAEQIAAMNRTGTTTAQSAAPPTPIPQPSAGLMWLQAGGGRLVSGRDSNNVVKYRMRLRVGVNGGYVDGQVDPDTNTFENITQNGVGINSNNQIQRYKKRIVTPPAAPR